MNEERTMLIIKIRMWIAITIIVVGFTWLIVDGLKRDGRIGGDRKPDSSQSSATE